MKIEEVYPIIHKVLRSVWKAMLKVYTITAIGMLSWFLQIKYRCYSCPIDKLNYII